MKGAEALARNAGCAQARDLLRAVGYDAQTEERGAGLDRRANVRQRLRAEERERRDRPERRLVTATSRHRARTKLEPFLPERAPAAAAPTTPAKRARKDADLDSLLVDSGWSGHVPDDLSSIDVVVSDEDRRKPRHGYRAMG